MIHAHVRTRAAAYTMRALGGGALATLILLILAGFTTLCAETITLQSPPAHVNDGDTFEADLNGNGRLEFPRERVRLLYVDTPELSRSRKGKDLRHGLPARAFLLSALQRLPLALRVDPARPVDGYGRTLALVSANGVGVNLRLIRHGHSYFDTRFGFPRDYERYAEAEGAAFEERKGIWSTTASRNAYLKRLRKEGKTPLTRGNRLAEPDFLPAARSVLGPRAGKFLRLTGRLLKRRMLRGGAWKLTLAGGGIRADGAAEVFVSRRVNAKLTVQGWPLGARMVVDGFAQLYRGTPQLVLHHGRLLRDGAVRP